MKKIILFSATALSLLLPAASIAADLGRPAPVYKAPPPPAPVYSWTGCYVGAGGGYGMWNQENSDLGPGDITAIQTGGGRGWFGTAQFGCDYQLSSDWVIGAFVDGDFGSLSGHPHFPVDAFGNEKEKWAWAVGARLGYVVIPNLLAYVSGGWRDVASAPGRGATARPPLLFCAMPSICRSITDKRSCSPRRLVAFASSC